MGYLQREGVETVGLETMPQTPKNLNLYTKLGFRIGGLSFFMERKLTKKEYQTGSRSVDFEVAKTAAKDAVSKIRKVCAESLGGIDYSREAYFVEKYEDGKILLANHNKKWVGFAICYPFKRPNQNTKVLAVKFSAIVPDYCGDLQINVFTSSWKEVASRCDCSGICARCYSANYLTLNRLISEGYVIYNSHVKMYKGKPLLDDIATFHIERWGG
ncbi:MAG: hypothetical protein OEY22_10635 [Candidatus Bathyarchaeota archaeon]|nr:hypothetical protein [Candidatus Bathyarchaeota archaeon]MDH5788477.1 hypothetical protein [Candidatus Bathyarchaeota archaeon]